MLYTLNISFNRVCTLHVVQQIKSYITKTPVDNNSIDILLLPVDMQEGSIKHKMPQCSTKHIVDNMLEYGFESIRKRLGNMFVCSCLRHKPTNDILL